MRRLRARARIPELALFRQRRIVMCFRRIVSLFVGMRKLRRQGSNRAVALHIRLCPIFEDWKSGLQACIMIRGRKM